MYFRIRRWIGQHSDIALLAAAAFALRVILVLRGGQSFWPDEARYFRTGNFFASLVSFRISEALAQLIEYSDHNGFTLVCLPPAMLQALLKRMFHLEIASTLWIPSLWLSLASVGCIIVTYAIALRSGARRHEAFFAAFLLACSNTLFYMSRHLIPYDSALLLMLISLWFGMERSRDWKACLLCGFFAGFSFVTYNGSWTGVLFVLVASPLLALPNLRKVARYATFTAIGFLTLPLLFQMIGACFSSVSYFTQMRQFGATATQGDFKEGWSLPWEYFWSSERAYFGIWVAGALAWPFLVFRKFPPARERGALWLFGILVPYALLCLFSNGLGQCVVYGRSARVLVPYFCLLGACVADYFKAWFPRPSKFRWEFAAILALAVSNFAGPFALTFPKDFQTAARRDFGELDFYATVPAGKETGWALSSSGGGQHPTVVTGSGPVLVNLQSTFWTAASIQSQPTGRVLRQAPHPLQFRPYQFEGYSGKARELLQSADISMRVMAPQE